MRNLPMPVRLPIFCWLLFGALLESYSSLLLPVDLKKEGILVENMTQVMAWVLAESVLLAHG